MAVLTIRNLPEEVRTRLRVRASRNGRSMEAEARAIVSAAVNAPSSDDLPEAIERLQDWIASSSKRFKSRPKSSAVDQLLRDRRRDAIREAIQDGLNPKMLFRGHYGRILSEAGWTAQYVENLVKQTSP
jgi:plasmid stability protein